LAWLLASRPNHNITNSVADIEKVLDILAFLLLKKNSHSGGSCYGLNRAEELLGIDFRSALLDMHSLLDVPPPCPFDARLPTVYHASLEDFLMDRSRSRQYYIGRSEGHLRLSRYWLKVMGRSPHFEHLKLWQVLLHFGNHARQSSVNEDLANHLAQLDLKTILEGISEFRENLHTADWWGFFDGAKNLVSPNNFN
jgi:hypothetical protein